MHDVTNVHVDQYNIYRLNDMVPVAAMLAVLKNVNCRDD